MAMTTAECDRMIAACRAHHVRLGIAYYRHFYPVILRVKAMLESGDIGQPVFAQVNAFEYFDPAPDHPRRWLLDPARAGGGPMMDFGCHRLEVLMHLFGAVRRTAAVTANVVFDRAVEDTAAVLLQFEGGPCAAVTVTHAAEERQDTLQVFGTRGSLHVDELNAGSLRIRTGNQSRVESHPPAANIHRPLIDDSRRGPADGPGTGGDRRNRASRRRHRGRDLCCRAVRSLRLLASSAERSSTGRAGSAQTPQGPPSTVTNPQGLSVPNAPPTTYFTDPDVLTVDPAFGNLRSGELGNQAAVDRGAVGRRARHGAARGDIWCGATSRTTVNCAGSTTTSR